MKEKIIIAGHGGQGIILAGSLLANTAMNQNLQICGTISYGVQMRGGTTNSSMILSDKKIESPIITKPTVLLILNQPALDKYENLVEKNGLVILNTSDCKTKVSRDDVCVVEVDATKIAEKLGNKKATNMVMVGAYLKKNRTLDIKLAKSMVKKVLPKASEELIELNKKALLLGYTQ